MQSARVTSECSASKNHVKRFGRQSEGECEKRHRQFLVMGDSVTTVEGITFVAMRPFVCFPVGDTIRVTIWDPVIDDERTRL